MEGAQGELTEMVDRPSFVRRVGKELHHFGDLLDSRKMPVYLHELPSRVDDHGQVESDDGVKLSRRTSDVGENVLDVGSVGKFSDGEGVSESFFPHLLQVFVLPWTCK